MVKNKKILKRVAALGAVALLLLVGVAPALMPAANAMFIVPKTDKDNNYLTPKVAHLLLPLDTFTSEYHHISFENPMYSVCVGQGYNERFYIALPELSMNEDYLGNTAGWWKFDVLSYNSTVYDDYRVRYGIQIDSSMNANAFSMSSSQPFVSTISDISYFLNFSDVRVDLGYTCTVNVSFDYLYPYLLTEGGYELMSGAFSKECVRVNLDSGAETFSMFDVILRDASLPTVLKNDPDRMIIVQNFRITLDYYNSLSDGVGDSDPSLAWYQSFSLMAAEDSQFLTLDDFYAEYPGHRVIVSDDPGANNFDLTVFLKNSVGSFMATEIMPGLSFGGLLGVAIGLSLTVVFLKFFGG